MAFVRVTIKQNVTTEHVDLKVLSNVYKRIVSFSEMRPLPFRILFVILLKMK